jgi:WD40 repeat protein
MLQRGRLGAALSVVFATACSAGGERGSLAAPQGSPAEVTLNAPVVAAPSSSAAAAGSAANELAEWPEQKDARWPASCLLENLGVHPKKPWLALACTNPKPLNGAVLVFDLERGTLLSSTPVDEGAGWNENRALLRWHANGKVLTSNFRTNGIGLFDRATFVGAAYPDQGRDSGVEYVWIGDRVFTDTGDLFAIQPGERFEFTSSQTAPRWFDLEWNAELQAVVGPTEKGLAAYDPLKQKLVYERALEGRDKLFSPNTSADGRRIAFGSDRTRDVPHEVLVFDTKDGSLLHTLQPSGARIDAMVWGPDGRLAVSSTGARKRGEAAAQHLDVFRGAQRVSLKLGGQRLVASNTVDEAESIAWSPDGRTLALLFADQELRLVASDTAKVIRSFPAVAAPISPALPPFYSKPERPQGHGGVLWVGPHCVRLAPHFVSVFSVEGKKLFEWVTPDP